MSQSRKIKKGEKYYNYSADLNSQTIVSLQEDEITMAPVTEKTGDSVALMDDYKSDTQCHKKSGWLAKLFKPRKSDKKSDICDDNNSIKMNVF